MSEALKDHMQEVTSHTVSGRLPNEDNLANGYETVYWTAGGSPVEIENAETNISDALNMPKAAVRTQIVKPLLNRGYLTLKQGVHEVRYRPNVDLSDDTLPNDPNAEEEATA